MNHEPRGQWLPTSQAAAMLHVTPKTIRRRIKAGELEARKVARDGGGIVWQVCIGDESLVVTDSEADTEHPTKGTRKGQAQRVTDTETPSEKDMGVERKGHEADTDLTEHLLAEVAFLRATVEQLQRDGAETRAALRAALKLTGVASAPQLTTGTPEPPQAVQSGAANNVPSATPAAPEQPAKRTETTATGETDWNNVFANLADDLDQNVRK
jgi:hypothetical protein